MEQSNGSIGMLLKIKFNGSCKLYPLRTSTTKAKGSSFEYHLRPQSLLGNLIYCWILTSQTSDDTAHHFQQSKGIGITAVRDLFFLTPETQIQIFLAAAE